MPIRIACPSCAAALNLKDELAGRAVKCPRCGVTIPATATAAKPPAAPAFEVVEDDAPPPAPAARPQPPAPKAAVPPPAEVLPEDDDEDIEVSRKGRRGKKPASSKRSKLIVLGMLGYWALAVLASAWLNYRGTNRINLPGIGLGTDGTSTAATGTPPAAKSRPAPAPPNPVVPGRMATMANFDKLRVQTMTRTEAEQLLGAASQATPEQVGRATRGNPDDWAAKADPSRVLVWTTDKDELLVCLYPDAQPTARIQGKYFLSGSSRTYEGMSRPSVPSKNNPPPVSALGAEALARAFATDAKAAALKYDTSGVTIEGVVRTIEPDVDGGAAAIAVILEGATTPDLPVKVKVDPSNAAGFQNLYPGAKAKIRAKCQGLLENVVVLTDGRFDSQEVGAVAGTGDVLASALLSAYSGDGSKGAATYTGKGLRLVGCVVESVAADGSLVVAPAKTPKAMQLRIKVEFAPAWKEEGAKLKVGSVVRVVGTCTGLTDKLITITGAWPRALLAAK